MENMLELLQHQKKKITQFLDIGVKYIVHLVDCEMLRNSYDEVVKHFNINTK